MTGRTFLVEPHGELREDRQVGVKPHAFDSADPQRQERSFVLQSSELALDRATLAVQRTEPLGVARDERVQPVGLDPNACRCAFAGRASPLRSVALVVVGPGERPYPVVARRRLTLTGEHFAKRDENGRDIA